MFSWRAGADGFLGIGEILDEETASMAFRAAAVGRLVLSTLHINSPEGALTRLKDLGVSDYAIEASLRGVMSQRLEPKVCGECGEGCKTCYLNGRTGVIMTSKIKIP